MVKEYYLCDFNHFQFNDVFYSIGICSILENILENNVYVVVWGFCVMQMSIRSGWFIMLFNSSIVLLLFSLVILSINDSEILKFPTLIVCLCLPSVLWVFGPCILGVLGYAHICLQLLCPLMVWLFNHFFLMAAHMAYGNS